MIRDRKQQRERQKEKETEKETDGREINIMYVWEGLDFKVSILFSLSLSTIHSDYDY